MVDETSKEELARVEYFEIDKPEWSVGHLAKTWLTNVLWDWSRSDQQNQEALPPDLDDFVGALSSWMQATPAIRDEFFGWVGRESLTVSPSPRSNEPPPDNTNDGTVLPISLEGGYAEVVLQAKQLLNSSPGDANLALHLATGPLADALERLDYEASTPEQQVDVLVGLFANEAVHAGGGKQPKCSDGFLTFIARLRKLLNTQQRRGPDYLRTLTNLMTWTGSTRENRCLPCAVDIGLDILNVTPSTVSGTEEEWRTLSQVANNLAGWLDDLLPHKGDDDLRRGPQARRLNAIHALATVAQLRFIKNTREEHEDRARAVFTALDLPDIKNAAAQAQALSFMANVPSSWRLLCADFSDEESKYFRTRADEGNAPDTVGTNHPRYLTAVLAALAAAQKAVLNKQKDTDEVVASLFNLGVDLLQNEKSLPDVEVAPFFRILCNGLGLWWALLRGANDKQAVVDFRGGNCAVNLFGALTHAKCVQNDETRKPLQPLGLGLYTLLKKHARDFDAIRLGNSYKAIFGKTAEETEQLTPKDLRRWLIEVLRPCVSGFVALPDDLEAALDERTYPETLARLLNAAFESLAGQGKQTEEEKKKAIANYHMVRLGWLKVAERLVECANGPEALPFYKHIPTNMRYFGTTVSYEHTPDAQPEVTKGYLARTLRDKVLMRSLFFG